MTPTINKISFKDKDKYFMFDTSSLGFWIYITKIMLSHIHKNTVMNDELIVSLQSSMLLLPTKLPIILLQRVEVQFPAWKEKCYLSACRQKNDIILFWEFVWPKVQNVF